MPKKTDTKGSASGESKAGRKSRKFTSEYIRLRTILDAIEMGSLRFALTGATPEERLKRAEKLIEKLHPVAEKISRWNEQGPSAALLASRETDDPCPDGYYYCYGVCLPYPCPPESGNE